MNDLRSMFSKSLRNRRTIFFTHTHSLSLCVCVCVCVCVGVCVCVCVFTASTISQIKIDAHHRLSYKILKSLLWIILQGVDPEICPLGR